MGCRQACFNIGCCAEYVNRQGLVQALSLRQQSPCRKARPSSPASTRLAVGVLVGVVCYLAGREVASVVCGLAAFVGSLAAEVGSRLRELLPLLVASDS